MATSKNRAWMTPAEKKMLVECWKAMGGVEDALKQGSEDVSKWRGVTVRDNCVIFLK